MAQTPENTEKRSVLPKKVLARYKHRNTELKTGTILQLPAGRGGRSTQVDGTAPSGQGGFTFEKLVSVVKSIPKIFGEAKTIVAPGKRAVVEPPTQPRRDAFAPPAGIDVSTAEGQRIMARYRAVRVQRDFGQLERGAGERAIQEAKKGSAGAENVVSRGRLDEVPAQIEAIVQTRRRGEQLQANIVESFEADRTDELTRRSLADAGMHNDPTFVPNSERMGARYVPKEPPKESLFK